MKKRTVIMTFCFATSVFLLCSLLHAAEINTGQRSVAAPSKTQVQIQDMTPETKAAVLAQAAEKAKKLSVQRKAVMKQKRQQEIMLRNTQTMTRIRNMKTSTRAVQKSTGSLEIIKEPMQMSASASRPTSSMKVSSVTPQPVSPGQSLTILGESFGTRMGRVSLNVERMWVSLPINTWRETHLIVTIPEGLAGIVGARQTDARIWVHHAEGNGATMTLRVGPDMARLTPHIESRSPSHVSPGEILLLHGRNFLSEAGKVRFIYGSTTIEGIVDLWDDTVVAVHLREDLEGYPWNTLFSIEIENSAGLKHRRTTVALDPNVETEVLIDTIEHIAYSGNNCSTWYDQRDPVSRGYITFQGLHLQNGWRVTGANLYAYYSPGRPSGRCVYALRPLPEHADFLETGIYITTAQGFCSMFCDHIVEIEGPKGFYYR